MLEPATETSALHRAGSGPPLLLLHGLTASWRAWLPILDPLEAEHDVIAMTLPGHRGAPPLAEGTPATVIELATAVESRLDDLGLGTVAVVGNSLGGWVALELARRGRASATVALSPAGAWRTQKDARQLVRQLRLGRWAMTHAGDRTKAFLRRPRGRRLVMKQICEHGDRIPVGEVPGLFDDAIGTTVMDDLIASVLRDGPIEPITTAAGPIRIAWGGSDRTLPYRGFAEPMYERVPVAEKVTIPGVGHVPMPDDPALVARTILEVTR